jgi:hypothetical protein
MEGLELMRWLHFAAVLLAIFVLQGDMPAWLDAIAVITFATNLFAFIEALDEDLRDV